MRRPHGIRSLRLLILLLPAAVAFAQGGPPPPPAPLTPPPVPPANPLTVAKANLGKVLFWDEQLSSTRTVACGTCHRPHSGGTDPRTVAGSLRATNPGNDGLYGTADDVLGSPGVQLDNADASLAWSATYGYKEQVTPRRSPSAVDAAYPPLLFWDGRAGQTFLDPVTGDTLIRAGAALENQAAGPPTSSTEMGHIGRDWPNAAARIAASKPLALALNVPSSLVSYIGGRDYPALFNEAFGTPAVTPARIIMAIATYERTTFSSATPFDSVNAGVATLTPIENQGRQLFGALPCAVCHGGTLLTNNAFHYIGVTPVAQDSGRMVVTHNPADLGAFRVPSLRNVALKPSYMHDGRFHTLTDVVNFYNRGGDFTAPNKDPLIRPLGLNPGQIASLVAFLSRPLTDPRVANETAPFDRPMLYSESGLVPQVVGSSIGGSGGQPQPIALEPPLAGNSGFTMGVFGALGGAPAVLVVNDGDPGTAGIPETGSFARIAFNLAGFGAGNGNGSVTLPIADDPQLYGKQLFARFYVTDATAPGGVAVSPLVQFRIFGPGAAGVLAVGDSPVQRQPRALQLFANRPNPFVGGTTIHYALFSPSQVKVTLFDAQGRQVRRLVDAPLQAVGEYNLSWDGHDDAGRTVAGGIYFYRVEAGGTVATNRMVKL